MNRVAPYLRFVTKNCLINGWVLDLKLVWLPFLATLNDEKNEFYQLKVRSTIHI